LRFWASFQKRAKCVDSLFGGISVEVERKFFKHQAKLGQNQSWRALWWEVALYSCRIKGNILIQTSKIKRKEKRAKGKISKYMLI